MSEIFKPADFSNCTTPEEIASAANQKYTALKAKALRLYAQTGEYLWLTFKAPNQKVRTGYVFEIEEPK